MTGIPQAAGITGTLTAAGLSEDEIRRWFAQPRRELGGFTPGAALALFPAAGSSVLELARRDAAELSSHIVPEPRREAQEGVPRHG